MTARKLIVRTSLGAIACLAGIAQAHHSYTSFDPRFITMTGTVKDFQYTSPHIWTQILVRNAQGKDIEWGLETGSPASMRADGWTAKMLKVGDKITVTMHPKRDGSLAGSVVSMTLPSGKVIKAGDLVVGRPGAPGGPGGPPHP